MDKSARSENSQVRTNIIHEFEETISITKTTKLTRVRQSYNNNNNKNNNHSRKTSATGAATARNHRNRCSFDNKPTTTTTTISRSNSLPSTNFQLQALNQRIEHEIDKLEKYRAHLLSNKKMKQTRITNKESHETMTWRDNLAANKSKNKNIQLNYENRTRISSSSYTAKNDDVAIKPRLRTIGVQEVQSTRNAVIYNCVRLEQKTEQANRTTNVRPAERESGGCTFGHANQMQCSVYNSDFAGNAANCYNYQQMRVCPHCHGCFQQPTMSAFQYCTTATVCMPSPRCYCSSGTRQSTDLNTEDFCRNRAHGAAVERSRSSSAKRKEAPRRSLERQDQKARSRSRSKSKSPNPNQKTRQLPEGLSKIPSLHKYRVKEKEQLIKLTLKRSSQTNVDTRESASSIQGIRITEYQPPALSQQASDAKQEEAEKSVTEEEKQKMYKDYLEKYKAETNAKTMEKSGTAKTFAPSAPVADVHKLGSSQDSGSDELRGDKTYSKIPFPEATKEQTSKADNERLPDDSRRDHQTNNDESSWVTQGAEGQGQETNSYNDQYQTSEASNEQQHENHNQSQKPTSPQQQDLPIQKQQEQTISQQQPIGQQQQLQPIREQQQQHPIEQQQPPISQQRQQDLFNQQQPIGQHPQQQLIREQQQQHPIEQQQPPISQQRQQDLFNQQQPIGQHQQQQPIREQQQQHPIEQQQQKPPISQQRQQDSFNEEQQFLINQQRYDISQQQQHSFNQREQISSMTYVKQLTKIKRVERPTQTDNNITCCRTDFPREIYEQREKEYFNIQCPRRRRQFDEIQEPRFETQPSYEKRSPHRQSPQRENQFNNRQYEDQTSAEIPRNYERQDTSGCEDYQNRLRFATEESPSCNLAPFCDNRCVEMQPLEHNRFDKQREEFTRTQIPEPSNYDYHRQAQQRVPLTQRQQAQLEYNRERMAATNRGQQAQLEYGNERVGRITQAVPAQPEYNRERMAATNQAQQAQSEYNNELTQRRQKQPENDRERVGAITRALPAQPDYYSGPVEETTQAQQTKPEYNYTDRKRMVEATPVQQTQPEYNKEITQRRQKQPENDSERVGAITQALPAQPEYESKINLPRVEAPTNSTRTLPAYRQIANNGASMPVSAQKSNYQYFESEPVRLANLAEDECVSVTSICKSYKQVVCTTTRRAPRENQSMIDNENQVHKNIIERQRDATSTGNMKLPPQATAPNQKLEDLSRRQVFEDAPMANSTEYEPSNWSSEQQKEIIKQRDQIINSERVEFQPQRAILQEQQMLPSKSIHVFDNNTDSLRSALHENAQPVAEHLATEPSLPPKQQTDYESTFIPENIRARNGPPLSSTRTMATQSQTERRQSVDFDLPPFRSLPNQAMASIPQYTNHQRQRSNTRYQRRQPMEWDGRRYRNQMPDQRIYYDTDEFTSYSSSSPSSPAYRQTIRNRPMQRRRSPEMLPNRRQCKIVESRETVVLRRNPIDWERCRQSPQMLIQEEEYSQPVTDYCTTEDDAIPACPNFGSCSTLQTCMDSDYGDYLTCDESQGDDNNNNNTCQQLPEFKGCACMYNTYLNMAAMCMPRQHQQAISPRKIQNHEARYTQQQQQQQRSFY